jgi:hypothetical protein
MIDTKALIEAAESAVTVLKCVEWNDDASATDAANVRIELELALRETLRAAEAVPAVGQDVESRQG